MKLTFNEMLQHAVTIFNEGKIVKAEHLFRNILQIEPTHPDANHYLAISLQILGRLQEAVVIYKKTIKLKPEYSSAHQNLGNTLMQLKKFEEAELSYRKAIELNPDNVEVHFNLGNNFKNLNKLEEAEISYRKAIALKPNIAEAHYNLGVILQELGRPEEAEKSYRKAIMLKPDLAEAYYNFGITLKQLGRPEEAEKNYRKAIMLKPDYAEAIYNLGSTLNELGRLQEAMNNYIKAIKLDPHLPGIHQSLVELLTCYASQEKDSHPIVKIDQEIKKINLKEKTLGIISDDKIIQLFSKSSSIIKEQGLKIRTNLSEVYRRNSIDLNCKRHLAIFNKFNVIPKFCFGCYKVQVEPRSILELIKLLVIFDQIKLVENNTRKCMIETRAEISGFYKGLIYCSSIEEAYQIADYLDTIIKENIRPGLHVVIKRGCSEYAISFPNYKAINKSGPQLMNYNEDWKSIEEDYDSLNLIKSSRIITPSLSGLNLQDVLIIRNWIDYAKGIGDSSVHLLNENIIFSPKIYNKAKTRIEKYPWQEFL